MAFNSKLSDKFNIRITVGLLSDIFKINIYSIKLIVECGRHNLIDESGSGRCVCEYRCSINIFILKIAEKAPYLNALWMTVIYVILACQICETSIVVIQIKPCRWHDIDTLGGWYDISYLWIGRFVGYLMPCKTYILVLLYMGEGFLCIIIVF